jgi:hypothetical protein
VHTTDKYFYLPEGWYFAETWGRWSIGQRSRLKFYPAQNLKNMSTPVLRIKGRYFDSAELTRVYADGVHIGDFDLRDGQIPLPADCLKRSVLCMEFVHENPNRPSSGNGTKENRAIKFGLENISLVEDDSII